MKEWCLIRIWNPSKWPRGRLEELQKGGQRWDPAGRKNGRQEKALSSDGWTISSACSHLVSWKLTAFSWSSGFSLTNRLPLESISVHRLENEDNRVEGHRKKYTSDHSSDVKMMTTTVNDDKDEEKQKKMTMKGIGLILNTLQGCTYSHTWSYQPLRQVSSHAYQLNL